MSDITTGGWIVSPQARSKSATRKLKFKGPVPPLYLIASVFKVSGIGSSIAFAAVDLYAVARHQPPIGVAAIGGIAVIGALKACVMHQMMDMIGQPYGLRAWYVIPAKWRSWGPR